MRARTRVVLVSRHAFMYADSYNLCMLRMNSMKGCVRVRASMCGRVKAESAHMRGNDDLKPGTAVFG